MPHKPVYKQAPLHHRKMVSGTTAGSDLRRAVGEANCSSDQHVGNAQYSANRVALATKPNIVQKARETGATCIKKTG